MKSFSYDEIMVRTRSTRHHLVARRVLEDLDNLPSPEVLAREIVEDLPPRCRSLRQWQRH